MLFDRLERFIPWLGFSITGYCCFFQYLSAREGVAVFVPQTVEQVVISFLIICLSVWPFIRIFFLSFPKVVTVKRANKMMRDAIATKRTMVIHTKHLSVADDPEFFTLINGFSRDERNNIIFVVPNETEKSEKLRGLGLQVQVLPEGFPALKSRFTILDPDGPTEKARIANAIGNNKIELYEFRPSSGHLFSFADDLRKVIKFTSLGKGV